MIYTTMQCLTFSEAKFFLPMQTFTANRRMFIH